MSQNSAPSSFPIFPPLLWFSSLCKEVIPLMDLLRIFEPCHSGWSTRLSSFWRWRERRRTISLKSCEDGEGKNSYKSMHLNYNKDVSRHGYALSYDNCCIGLFVAWVVSAAFSGIDTVVVISSDCWDTLAFCIVRLHRANQDISPLPGSWLGLLGWASLCIQTRLPSFARGLHTRSTPLWTAQSPPC